MNTYSEFTVLESLVTLNVERGVYLMSHVPTVQMVKCQTDNMLQIEQALVRNGGCKPRFTLQNDCAQFLCYKCGTVVDYHRMWTY